MKKVNLEVIIKLTILLGFSLFEFILVKSNMITLYVHPRIIPFVKVSIPTMIIISFFLLFDVMKIRTVKRRMRNYIVFIIPFVMMLGMKPANNSSASSVKSNFLGDKADNLNKKEVDDNKKANLDKDGTIKVTEGNYINFIEEVENNIDEYINKDVEIIGYVYRTDGMDKNQFALVRNMMVCCTADMQMVGLLCDSSEASKYEVDTWIKVNGTIEKELENEDAVIKVKKIEKVEAPKTPYVYPY